MVVSIQKTLAVLLTDHVVATHVIFMHAVGDDNRGILGDATKYGCSILRD